MQLDQEVEKFGVSLTGLETGKLISFAEMVWTRGKPAGLSGRESLEEVLRKDVLDSLSLAPYIGDSKKVLDIGSGAGFPAIPLKILFQAVSFFVVDAKRKSVVFLEGIIKMLALEGIRVFWKRAEELSFNPEWKEQFDLVLGRAVLPFPKFLVLAAPFLKPGGRMLLQKGKLWEEEHKKTKKQLYKMHFLVESVNPGPEGQQKIIVIRKN